MPVLLDLSVMLEPVLLSLPRPLALLAFLMKNALWDLFASMELALPLLLLSHAPTTLTATEIQNTLENANATQLTRSSNVFQTPTQISFHHVLPKETPLTTVLNPRDVMKDLLELTAATMKPTASSTVKSMLLVNSHSCALTSQRALLPPRALQSLSKLAFSWLLLL